MYLADDARQYLRETGPQHDEMQREMAEYADEHDFPIIGPDAGGLLRAVARTCDADRIFEFGSGFGYSASWFLQGMPEGGEIILTEFDGDEIAMAEDFFEDAGLADRAQFEHGDAMDIIEQYDGQFDVVLIDHQKHRYADAFEAIRDQIPVGGAVVADNILRGAVDYRDILPYFADGEPLPGDENTRGIAAFLERLHDDEAFHTVVLPVGSGLTLSTRER